MAHTSDPSKNAYAEEQEQYWSKEHHCYRRHPKHPVIRGFVQDKINFIVEHTDLPDHPSILDVGAGNGYASDYWNELGRTVATDYSNVMLEKNPVTEKYVMDARALKFPDDSFDISFCMAVLHHIHTQDRAKVIQEMARVSKRYVAIIEPNSRNPLVTAFCYLKKEERGGLDFTPQYTRNLLEEAGLRIIKACSWGLLTPNRMPLSSLFLPFFRVLERPLPFGVVNIVLAEKAKTF